MCILYSISYILLPVNTLELIGSPSTNRPRVKQPSGNDEFCTMSPIARKKTPKYENTEQQDLAVPMPGTPSQNVKVMTFQILQWISLEYTNA